MFTAPAPGGSGADGDKVHECVSVFVLDCVRHFYEDDEKGSHLMKDTTTQPSERGIGTVCAQTRVVQNRHAHNPIVIAPARVKRMPEIVSVRMGTLRLHKQPCTFLCGPT